MTCCRVSNFGGIWKFIVQVNKVLTLFGLHVYNRNSANIQIHCYFNLSLNESANSKICYTKTYVCLL